MKYTKLKEAVERTKFIILYAVIATVVITISTLIADSDTVMPYAIYATLVMILMVLGSIFDLIRCYFKGVIAEHE